MGASGVTLRLNRVPFNGTKTAYSKNDVITDTEDKHISNFKEYTPFDTTEDKTVSDFPNNLTKEK